MKRITVSLTIDQANYIANVLEENWLTSGTPRSQNMFDIRIIDKIRTAMFNAVHDTKWSEQLDS